MSFLDSLLGRTRRTIPDWTPTHLATLEVTYDDLRSAFGRGSKDDVWEYTFWEVCAEDLDDDLIDEDDCAQISNRNPKVAGTPMERGPRKDVKSQERFYILATSRRMIDAVADASNASVFQRRTVT